MEFSRPEYWSGVAFSFLQGIFPTQGSNPGGTMAVRAHNPNYWTARELPKFIFKENQDQFKTGEGLFFPWESAEFTDFYFW